MSLHEVKNALDRIFQVNKNLDEEKLKTLLGAGGWSESDIKTALFLFKERGVKNADTSVSQVVSKDEKGVSGDQDKRDAIKKALVGFTIDVSLKKEDLEISDIKTKIKTDDGSAVALGNEKDMICLPTDEDVILKEEENLITVALILFIVVIVMLMYLLAKGRI